jgi:hypothetical protein
VKSIERRGAQDSGVDASLPPRYGVADVTAESRVFDFGRPPYPLCRAVGPQCRTALRSWILGRILALCCFGRGIAAWLSTLSSKRMLNVGVALVCQPKASRRTRRLAATRMHLGECQWKCRGGRERALATRVDILIRCSVARGIRPAESGQPEEIAIPHTVCLHRVMSARERSCIEHLRRYIELLFKKEKRTRGKENGT